MRRREGEREGGEGGREGGGEERGGDGSIHGSDVDLYGELEVIQSLIPPYHEINVI